MKLFEIDIIPVYPVPHGLLILAETKERALEIAKEEHQEFQDRIITLENITEIDLTKEGTIFYESGEY